MQAETRGRFDALLDSAVHGWRILGALGLVDQIFNHISVAAEGPTGELMLAMNPDGYFPEEIDRANLRVFPLRDYKASEAAALGVNPDGLRLHSLLHSARMREGVIVHTHSPHAVAVGCSEQGLLPLTQGAMEFVGDIKAVDYDGVFRSQELAEPLQSLARHGGVALLRNHGVLIVADNVHESVYVALYLEDACRTQVAVLSQGVSLRVPSAAVVATTHDELCGDRAKEARRLFDALLRRHLATTRGGR